MHRFRTRAGLAALAVVIVASGCKYTGFGDSSVRSTSTDAHDWLVTQQRTDGGFEVADFDGFETPDAIVALAEEGQEQAGWDTLQARRAVRKVTNGGKSALDWADAFADGPISAGQAAKLIVLVAKPLGLGVRTFNPGNDADTRDLVAIVEDGAQPDGSYGAFNATLYATLAGSLVNGAVPANTVAYIRAGQESSGAWDYAADPSGADGDVDTTSLALLALVAAGAAPTDTDLVQGLAYLAHQQRPNGAWQAFGTDDPNSTATAIMAITAAGGNAVLSCWRDSAVPALTGTPYSSPIAWLQSQAGDDGHIVSQNDAFPPVNTFATTQSIEALRRGWLPFSFQLPKSCP
jgi:hypothetical protein